MFSRIKLIGSKSGGNHMYDTDQLVEKIIIAGIESDSNAPDIEMCLDELEEQIGRAHV